MPNSPPPKSPSSADPIAAANLAAAALAAPARVWSSFVSRLHPLQDSRLLAAVSDLHRYLFGGRRRRRLRPALPLPVYDAAEQSDWNIGEMPTACVILEEIVQHTLSNLHTIQESLLYWKSRARETNSRQMYFMIFQRGPKAFVETSSETLTRFRSNRGPSQYLLNSAKDMVSTNIAVLTSIQCCLATFLAQVYSEVDRRREGLTENSDKSLHTLFIVLNTVFPKLEVSLRNVGVGKSILFTHDGNSSELLFKRLPEVDVESSHWTESLSSDAIRLIYQNLQKLDSFVSSQLSIHEKPRNITIYWLPYTCGAIGLAACSLWVLRHSSLMGSPDLANWMKDAKESAAGFWDERIEKPIISIRDELFKTFKQSDKQKQDVRLTEESLHRMLLAFCEQTSDEKLPQDASTQALMEIAMKRYEKETMNPIKNLLGGELARAMLIKIQKHTLDIQEAMLELDQILKANAINFAVLAALPAFGLSLLLLFLMRAWITHDQGAEGRGRIARRQRRQLLVDVEERLMEFQDCMVHGMEEEACCKYGLTLYTLDRLCKAVEWHAQEIGERSSLRQAIYNLAKPNMEMTEKMVLLARMKWMYDCLLPSPAN